MAALRERVGDLPSEQRQVLLLQLQHGLSPAEIGVGNPRSRRGRSRGRGTDKPARGDVLHLVVHHGADEIVRADVPANIWSQRGFYSWSFDRVFAFGRYEVEGWTDAGQRYRTTFAVRDDLDDPTQVIVPLVGR